MTTPFTSEAGVEQRRHQPPTGKAGATDEDAAAAHRRSFAARRQPGQTSADDDAIVGLHVPESECALKDVDAEPGVVAAITARRRDPQVLKQVSTWQ
jgi:hypothetical protein